MKVIASPSLYVYYRISEAKAETARGAAARLADLLAAQRIERPRLMRRPEANAQGQQTWMEVYERWDPSWLTTLDRAVTDSGLGALIEGSRHLELFIDLPPLEEGEKT